MSYEGKERRESMDVAIELRALSERFDNELGSANGSHEGSVKRHLSRIQSSIERIEKVIIGDGVTAGISEKVNQITNSFNEHTSWDRWLFGILISGQLMSLYKQFFM